jgi:small subunit ribosomal protein S9
MADEPTPETSEEPTSVEPTAETPQEPSAEEPAAEQQAAPPGDSQDAGQLAVPTEEAAEIASVIEDAPLEAFEEAHAPAAPVEAAEQSSPEPAEAAAEQPNADVAAEEESSEEDEEELEEPTPRVKPTVPGAHLEVDIVPEGVDPLGRGEPADPYAIEDEESQADAESGGDEEPLAEPISTAAIDLAAGARYRATGKRKTAIARVTLRPGTGAYTVNGRSLEQHFPRDTLQRNIRQPLETVGYQDRMDVVARLHGGGISAQAGALRHGVSRALLEADPNLRGELKRRGFLTRDSRAKERKKAGLKKARKRPQFSKR